MPGKSKRAEKINKKASTKHKATRSQPAVTAQSNQPRVPALPTDNNDRVPSLPPSYYGQAARNGQPGGQASTSSRLNGGSLADKYMPPANKMFSDAQIKASQESHRIQWTKHYQEQMEKQRLLVEQASTSMDYQKSVVEKKEAHMIQSTWKRYNTANVPIFDQTEKNYSFHDILGQSMKAFGDSKDDRIFISPVQKGESEDEATTSQPRSDMFTLQPQSIYEKLQTLPFYVTHALYTKAFSPEDMTAMNERANYTMPDFFTLDDPWGRDIEQIPFPPQYIRYFGSNVDKVRASNNPAAAQCELPKDPPPGLSEPVPTDKKQSTSEAKSTKASPKRLSGTAESKFYNSAAASMCFAPTPAALEMDTLVAKYMQSGIMMSVPGIHRCAVRDWEDANEDDEFSEERRQSDEKKNGEENNSEQQNGRPRDLGEENGIQQIGREENGIEQIDGEENGIQEIDGEGNGGTENVAQHNVEEEDFEKENSEQQNDVQQISAEVNSEQRDSGKENGEKEDAEEENSEQRNDEQENCVQQNAGEENDEQRNGGEENDEQRNGGEKNDEQLNRGEENDEQGNGGEENDEQGNGEERNNEQGNGGEENDRQRDGGEENNEQGNGGKENDEQWNSGEQSRGQQNSREKLDKLENKEESNDGRVEIEVVDVERWLSENANTGNALENREESNDRRVEIEVVDVERWLSENANTGNKLENREESNDGRVEIEKADVERWLNEHTNAGNGLENREESNDRRVEIEVVDVERWLSEHTNAGNGLENREESNDGCEEADVERWLSENENAGNAPNGDANVGLQNDEQRCDEERISGEGRNSENLISAAENGENQVSGSYSRYTLFPVQSELQRDSSVMVNGEIEEREGSGEEANQVKAHSIMNVE